MWEIITGILGILGFVISLINFIIIIHSRYLKFTVFFGDYGFTAVTSDKDAMVIEFRIDNNSELPLSITRIQFKSGKNFSDTYPMPLKAGEITYSTMLGVYHRSISETTLPPINLAPLGSAGGYLAFPIHRGILPTDEKYLTFRIYTNRGKVIQRTFVQHVDTQCP